MKRTCVLSLVISLILCTALLVTAHARGDRKDRENRREKQRERIELLLTWKMMEELDLDKDTANEMLKIRTKFLKQKKKLRTEIRQKFRRMREMLEAPPDKIDDKELKSLLDDVRQSRKRMRTLWGKQYDEVSKILTVRQQAQLMVFLKDFKREMRRLRRMGRSGRPGSFRGPGQGFGRGYGGDRRGFHPPSPDRPGGRPRGFGPPGPRDRGNGGRPIGPPPGGPPHGPPPGSGPPGSGENIRE